MLFRSTTHVPPVIRVFLSSTFADMENERTYFNEVLVPRLNRLCADRGVSFFSIDLRWGITEEQQMDGQVLPICLSEIDRCRPYFIGILGNRYGSLMESVPPAITESIPWLKGREGTSITELEMLYAVLDYEQETPATYASFYFRDPDLTEAWYGPSEEDPHIGALKQRIAGNETVTHASYRTVEEFGDLVMRDILSWCDKAFPVPEKISEVRREWYDSELMRHYVPIRESHSFLDAYVKESRRSLLLHGTGERGKTSLLTAWQPREGSKLLINCGSDDSLRYWPTVVKTLIRELMAMKEETIMPSRRLKSILFRGMLSSKGEQGIDGEELYFQNQKWLEEYRLAFLEWITELKTSRPVCVVINDLDLDDDERTMMLSWLPVETRGSIRFICSTNREETVELAEIKGWNCKEMPPFTRENADLYFTSYLSVFGKSLSSEQSARLLDSPISRHAGHLRAAADFLINHGRFHNLDKLLADLNGLPDRTAFYPYLLEYLLGETARETAEAVDTVLALLLECPVSLNEQECYCLAGRFVSLTPFIWAAVSSILEQLHVIKGDYWNLTGHGLRAAVAMRTSPETVNAIREILGDYFVEMVKAAEEDGESGLTKRRITSVAKAALELYRKAGKNDKLLDALRHRGILLSLCYMEKPSIRAAWLHLILESDLDVPETLYGIFREILAEYGSDHVLTETVADLFADLELTTRIQDVNRAMGKRVGGSIHADYDLLSFGFISFMRDFLTETRDMDSRGCLKLISKALEEHPEFTDVEVCQLLNRKAMHEQNLGDKKEMLATVNRYFEAALRSGNLYEFLQAMDYRASVLYFHDRDSEAYALMEKLCGLYLSHGEFRHYVCCLNDMGNALTSMERHSEATALYERCQAIWTKVGQEDEADLVYVNMCNALHLQGKNEEALRRARLLYERQNAEDKSRLQAQLICNMGYYAFLLKEYAAAEDYLMQAKDIAEKTDRDPIYKKAVSMLGKIYTKTGLHMKGFTLMEGAMSTMWERGDLSFVLDSLDSACNFLRMCNHVRQAGNLWEAWRKKFYAVKGGRDLFDQRENANAFDSRETERLREALAMAKSEEDPLGIARAYVDLARSLREEEPTEFCRCLYTAADLYAVHEDHTGLLQVVTLLLTDCIKNGRADGDYLTKIFSHTADPVVLDVVGIWLELGEWGDEDSCRAKDRADFDRLLLSTLPMIATHTELTVACWTDLIDLSVQYASASTLLRILAEAPQNDRGMLEYLLETAFLKDMTVRIDAMKADYQGPETLRLLDFYERATEFLSAIASNNTGVVAGNIAIIYRRRKDQDKTLYYHRLSMEDYLRQGIPYDALIEKMNLATAYREFGRPDEAIAVLREALSEAEAQNIQGILGSIAGNLAAVLRDRGKPEDHEEIMACFAVEECYFREQDMARDLAISLINQTAYHLMRHDADQASPKLNEAREIIRGYRFKEFYQALAAMEAMVTDLNRSRDDHDTSDEPNDLDDPGDSHAEKNLSEEAARAFFEELLAVNDQFELKNLYVEDGYWNADCFLTKPMEVFFTKLRLMILSGRDNEVIFGALFSPARYASSARENLKAYVDWSNTLTFYEMTLRDGCDVQAVYRIRAANREELKERFHFYIQLWTADCLAMAMASVGMELASCQSLKLTVLNMDDDDDDGDGGGDE